MVNNDMVHLPHHVQRWLEKTTSRPVPAIVLGGSVNGLSFARSLGRRRIPTLIVDSDRLVGTYTRYGTYVKLPEVEKSPTTWRSFFEALTDRCDQRPVLFPTSDATCSFLAENSQWLRGRARFLVAGSGAMRSIVNKRRQYRIARQAGIPIPRTYFPESREDIYELANELPFPCILKPYRSHLGKKLIGGKVVVLDSWDDLKDAYSHVEGTGLPFMIQEMVPGGDEELYGYLAFWDAEGRERAWLTKQKLRQNPPLFGDGALQQTVEAPTVAANSRRLLRAFDYQGFVGVEYKYDSRDDTYRLMEINPRTVSGNQMAITAGVDFPWIGYNYLVNNHESSEKNERQSELCFRRDVLYVNEEWDFKAYLSLRKEGSLSFFQWVRSWVSAEAKALWAADDPLPLVVVLWRFCRAAIRRVVPFRIRQEAR